MTQRDKILQKTKSGYSHVRHHTSHITNCIWMCTFYNIFRIKVVVHFGNSFNLNLKTFLKYILIKIIDCKTCGKTFSMVENLKLHHFTHTKEKPFPCNSCDKSFSRSGTLKTHQTVHSGEDLERQSSLHHGRRTWISSRWEAAGWGRAEGGADSRRGWTVVTCCPRHTLCVHLHLQICD